jgi:daunorubicin resistance ABC transporter ATP-binding subunit
MDNAIVVERLEKNLGSVIALDGVDFSVPTGSVLGLLGPNGAGKTTAVRILTTILKRTAGRAEVLGIDVAAHPQAVRERIGLAGQYAAVDENLTGTENLWLVGKLSHLDPKRLRARGSELLERFDLADAAARPVRTYSGGMRRRLDLAAALVHRPEVLFLDEPTTGLDPQGRTDLWRVIEELVAEGATVLLTTQYLEEADRLADRIAVIERGRVIADGSPDQLKQRFGGDVVEVRATNPTDVERLVTLLNGLGSGPPMADLRGQRVTLPTGERVHTLLAAARRIEEAGISVDDLGVRRPSLDDVFLSLTQQSTPHRPAITPAAATA